MSDRKQCTCLDGICSEEANITYGVPQGSVLGPKLVILYINDLVDVIKSSNFYLHADDIVLYKNLRMNNVQTDFNLFLNDIHAVSTWCTTDELTINNKVQCFPKKSQY